MGQNQVGLANVNPTYVGQGLLAMLPLTLPGYLNFFFELVRGRGRDGRIAIHVPWSMPGRLGPVPGPWTGQSCHLYPDSEFRIFLVFFDIP
jgi:hypothetical protein